MGEWGFHESFLVESVMWCALEVLKICVYVVNRCIGRCHKKFTPSSLVANRIELIF